MKGKSMDEIMETKTVAEQMLEYCNCLNNKEVTEANVHELITLISSYTCWMQKPCETFLSSERTEVVDVPDCICDCDIYKFDPFYQPFDKDSFTFTLVRQEGLEETEIPVTEYVYSIADGNFRIKLPLEECGCKDTCGCPVTYKMIVSYVAGYDLIPDCLLPVFCEALQWIAVKNTCDCAECQPCEAEQEEGVIDMTTITGRLQDYFLNVLTYQYHKQLSLISICKPINRLWGIVV